jgi:hypothetical protein
LIVAVAADPQTVGATPSLMMRIVLGRVETQFAHERFYIHR